MSECWFMGHYQSMLKRAAKNVIKVNPTYVSKPDAVAQPLANTEAKTIAEMKPASTVSTKTIHPLGSNSTALVLPPPKLAVLVSLADSRPISFPVFTANCPAGLPERPPSTSARLPPPVSHHQSHRKQPSIPSRPMNIGPYRNGIDPEHHLLVVDGSKSRFPTTNPVPSAEAAEREALARAASAGQQKEDSLRHSANNQTHSVDFSQAPSSPSLPVDPVARLSNLTSSVPKVTRSTNTPPGTNHDEEVMHPPAFPSAPRADSIRRDRTFQNNLGAHPHLPSHPSSHVSTSTTASPRTRNVVNKRPNDENTSLWSCDERDSYDRRYKQDHRQLRDEPSRTRPHSVESIRSVRSGRDKDKHNNGSDCSEKRKQSRSSSDRHRDHGERISKRRKIQLATSVIKRNNHITEIVTSMIGTIETIGAEGCSF
ncbi:hypothetical protein VP01_4576g3 [Puccinia sorghi]|uniref:Uncharacterized protein n=1 Tax=Puccinia sorghi TaxID=27349 RepID=A0A0L6UNN3_9BASI|nr:hypothetical protein VP01_4576g3 [Puccinia sorghi]